MSELDELDELLDAAHKQACRVLINKADEQLVPIWLLVTSTSERMLVATPIYERTDKDLVAIEMRRVMKENQVIMYSLLMEAWITTHPKGADLDNVPMPSQSPNRQEAVIAIACNTDYTKSRSWKIKRNSRGRVTALIDQESFDSSTLFGRFDSLLRRVQ